MGGGVGRQRTSVDHVVGAGSVIEFTNLLPLPPLLPPLFKVLNSVEFVFHRSVILIVERRFRT